MSQCLYVPHSLHVLVPVCSPPCYVSVIIYFTFCSTPVSTPCRPCSTPYSTRCISQSPCVPHPVLPHVGPRIRVFHSLFYPLDFPVFQFLLSQFQCIPLPVLPSVCSSLCLFHSIFYSLYVLFIPLPFLLLVCPSVCVRYSLLHSLCVPLSVVNSPSESRRTTSRTALVS